jgi:hypothetical protein
MRPTIVSISGFASEVGKSSALCKLLKLIPAWEAIKITRGHYRSCGKDPETCCVSGLLSDHPHVISDQTATRIAGKDTGRYWDAGAAMVHWVIGTDDQIEEGVKLAIDRVKSEGVFIEGASFLKYVQADYSLMVADPGGRDIKSSAVRVMPRMNALLVNRQPPDASIKVELLARLARRGATANIPTILFEQDFPLIADQIRNIHRKRYSNGS